MYDLILVRYGEMTLKKKNYHTFLEKINNNIKSKCKKFSNLRFFNTDYRFYIELNGENYLEVLDVLNTVVGLHSYSLCKKVNSNIEDIAKSAIEIIKAERPQKDFTFKVETHRGNKAFPLTSLEISQEVAKRVLPEISGMSVDVHQPDLTVSIDLRSEGTYLYTKVIMGLGGYPSGIAGSGLLMISGGIDSPVAGFLTIKKGVKLSAIHYESIPHTSLMALQKVIDLLEKLALYTLDGKIDLFVVPFTDIQNKIYQSANNTYGITLMRRSMYRIASKFAKERSFQCLINGESIGQVASQTLESIFVVNEVTNIPIIRPLATFDKDEIIAISRKIKTYDISIRPYEDCCTVFVPEHPVIKPQLNLVLKEEDKCDLGILEEEAIKNIKKYEISLDKKVTVFSNDNVFTI